MGAVRDNNFFVVHGWMLNQLGLKGNELQVYAIIYGFSQTNGQEFTGSLQYLADWTNASTRTIMRSLQTLVENGLLAKRESYNNGVKACAYRCPFPVEGTDKMSPGVVTNCHGGTDKMSPGVVTNCHGGGVKMSINNISDNIPDNIPDKKDKGVPPTPPPEKKSTKRVKADTEAILARYATDPETMELLREWLKVRKAKRAPETEKALTLNLDKLDKLAQESGLSVPAYLEAVIARGWAAFFPIRETAQRPGGGFRQQPERSRIKTEDEYEAAMRASGFKVG